MLNIHIYPSTFEYESRILKVTKTLVGRGVVERALIIAMIKDSLPERQIIDEARMILRIRTSIHGESLLSKILRFVEWSLKVVLRLRNEAPNMVNCHSLSVMPLCVVLKWLHKCILVYEPHELETETATSRGIRKILSKFLERRFIRFADLTVVVGPAIENWYRNAYSIHAIVTVLNCPPYRERGISQLLRDEFSIPQHRKIVLYQGGLSHGRGIAFLLDAFEKTTRNDYVMVFMGYGELEGRIKAAASRCPRILIKQAVAPEFVLNYTASADIGISLIEDTNLSYHYCLPNKLFESVMARIPVIVSNLPEMLRVVAQTKAGLVLSNWSTEALWDALDEIERFDRDTLNQNLDEAAKSYCWEVQEQSMVDAYKKYVFRGSMV